MSAGVDSSRSASQAIPGQTPRIADFAYVVFADDWGRHPSSCQHIFRRITPQAEVLWVNTVGLRTPRLSLYDLRRSWEILSGWLIPKKRTAPAGPNVDSAPKPGAGETFPAPTVVRPVMLPFFHWKWAERVNQTLISRSVRKALKTFAPGKPKVLVSALPIIPGLFRESGWARKVYYCVDDFTTWPGVSGDTMQRLEQALLPHCDVVIATSVGLMETRGPKAPRAHLLTHGVDANHFGKASKKEPHALVRNLPKPVLGMFGSFDQRVDGALLIELARRHPEGTVVAIGPVDRDLGEFASDPNIRFPGAVPYAELPACIAGFDILILPYVVDASTDKINPLKLKEYLATGKPVVTSPLPEARRLGAYCHVAEKHAFAGAVAEALKEAGHPSADRAEALASFLNRESWESKAEEFGRVALEGL